MEKPRVEVVTNRGTFVIELDTDAAPRTTDNILGYVDARHYDDTIFHRVIPGFMIQGGGYQASFDKKPVKAPVESEADNGLKNRRGTVAMARTSDPHSATAQFFVNVVDNTFLDHTEPSGKGWGYTVFGKVISGMEVVDGIAASETGPKGPFEKDAPQDDVVIQSVRRL